jgi:hypothetical protein
VTPAEDQQRSGHLYERAESMAGLGVRFLGRDPGGLFASRDVNCSWVVVGVAGP